MFYLFKAMNSVLDVEVKRLDKDQPTKSFEDTDEEDRTIKHNANESRVVEEAEKNEDNEGGRDAGGSGDDEDDEDDEDDRILSEEDTETRKTYVIDNLSKLVKEINDLPIQKRFNEQAHMHKSIKTSLKAFYEAYSKMDFLPLEEGEAFRRAVAELIVATGYYELFCECLVRILHYITSEYYQNEADDDELFLYLYLSQIIITSYTDGSETLRTALAKFPGYLDACREILGYLEEHKGFGNMISSVSWTFYLL